MKVIRKKEKVNIKKLKRLESWKMTFHRLSDRYKRSEDMKLILQKNITSHIILWYCSQTKNSVFINANAFTSPRKFFVIGNFKDQI